MFPIASGADYRENLILIAPFDLFTRHITGISGFPVNPKSLYCKTPT
jgi:hypothetical protein